MLAERARCILNEVEAAMRAVRELNQTPQARVRIGLAPTLATMLATGP